jgi:hypothetical protein
VAIAGGGFLLAVLWFDLMFDVQAIGAAAGPLPEPVLASIAAYYRRVTTEAAPMAHLVAAVMVLTLVAAARDVARDATHRGRRIVALVLAAAPILLALTRVFPNAVALGMRTAAAEVQTALARGILRDHIICFVLILGFLAVELAAFRHAAPVRR